VGGLVWVVEIGVVDEVVELGVMCGVLVWVIVDVFVLCGEYGNIFL